MKKLRQFAFLLALSVMMITGFSSESMAASPSAYMKYVKTQMVPSLGNAAKLSGKIMKSSSDRIGSWCETQGVLSVYTADLNNDKEKEALVVYLKDVISQYDGMPYKELHISALTEKKGSVIMTQDVKIDNGIDSTLFTDVRVYVKTYKKTKYVVIQQFLGIDGCARSIFVLNMKANGKLAVRKAVYDPGYTSGIGLYRLPLSGVTNLLTIGSYSEEGKMLYDSEEEWNAAESKIYGSQLQKELKNYGLKVSVETTYFNRKVWLLKKNSKMKLLCSIKAKADYGNGYNYTYVLNNKTNFK